ncbi:hypothetical protein FC36_GL000201 [Ligilactobacillus equi DSM 15833 = JCM 10991]|uniref:Uncharacterized protein n=2 Tax=Ligilactobacillus equi TaxID=137357 RepID=A0A0R1TFJ8_9LACO|nr:hypothetical protein FC36_GL000201 [Ligilactobacillus equi DSM 15833 = JCM 10991]
MTFEENESQYFESQYFETIGQLFLAIVRVCKQIGNYDAIVYLSNIDFAGNNNGNEKYRLLDYKVADLDKIEKKIFDLLNLKEDQNDYKHEIELDFQQLRSSKAKLI